MTPAVTAARSAGIPFTVHELTAPVGGGLGAEGAAASGLPPERVFKTLVARLEGGRLVVGIVPLAGQLDLKRLARVAGGKRAAMATPREAERATGYVLGGISPLGQRTRLPTFLDEGALAFPSIFVSGGRRGLELEIAPEALLRACDGKAAAIARSGRGGG